MDRLDGQSSLFGISLAGATASLPVLVVAQVGDSHLRAVEVSNLGRNRDPRRVDGVRRPGLFTLIAVIPLSSSYLAHVVGRRMAPA
jgi:hypothetical protein